MRCDADEGADEIDRRIGALATAVPIRDTAPPNRVHRGRGRVTTTAALPIGPMIAGLVVIGAIALVTLLNTAPAQSTPQMAGSATSSSPAGLPSQSVSPNLSSPAGLTSAQAIAIARTYAGANDVVVSASVHQLNSLPGHGGAQANRLVWVVDFSSNLVVDICPPPQPSVAQAPCSTAVLHEESVVLDFFTGEYITSQSGS